VLAVAVMLVGIGFIAITAAAAAAQRFVAAHEHGEAERADLSAKHDEVLRSLHPPNAARRLARGQSKRRSR
jgi:hypothetical protein